MKNKRSKKYLIKKSKGITLIALVITIIVLLILAGVTIATLTGDNGILTQSGKAEEQTKEADAIEIVQIAVIGSFGTDGKIDIEELNKNLKNIEGLTYKGSKLSDSNKIDKLQATVRVSGYDIQINSNGGVEKVPEIIAKIRENPTEYYGKKVKNYKANDSDTNTYRIFYVDEDDYFKDGANTIYLKADLSNTNYNLNNYASYDSANTKIRTMNPDWAKGKKSDSDTKTRGESEFKDPNTETKKVTWNTNEQAAAYLCSPVNETNIDTTSLPWKGYYNSEYANYVIGGPSVEMYVKSYNKAYEGITDITNKYTLGANYRATSTPGYIYTLNGTKSTISNNDYWTGTNSLDYTKYNSMYCKNGPTYFLALASPSAGDSRCVCTVYNYNFDLRNNYYNGNFRISPLISLKSSFIPEVEE